MPVPFGFSVGDFYLLGDFALTVYKQCRDCSGQYRDLASEARQLANTVQDLEDVVRNHQLDPEKERQLLERGHGCKEVLKELEALLVKYNSLSTQSKRTWDRLSWDQQGGRDIRARLTSTVVMLTAFYNTLIRSSQIRIEKALKQLCHEYQSGHRDAGSIVTLFTSGGQDGDEGWSQIIRDLEDLGISEATVIQHKSSVMDWIAKAVNGEAFQEQTPAPAPTRPAVRSNLDSMARRGSLTLKHKNMSHTELAARVVRCWNKREWQQAQSHLQQQMDAVQAGQKDYENGQVICPNVRMLRFLMGVSASFKGNFEFAKSMFELVVRKESLNFDPALPPDLGDMVAARWLGDACLQLNQLENATLAWSAAAIFSENGKNLSNDPKLLQLELYALQKNTGNLEQICQESRWFDAPIKPETFTLKWSISVASLSQIFKRAWDLFRSCDDYDRIPRRSVYDISIDSAHILQSLRKRLSWPLLYDPFFLVEDSLFLVSRTRNISEWSKTELSYARKFGNPHVHVFAHLSQDLVLEALYSGTRARKGEFIMLDKPTYIAQTTYKSPGQTYLCSFLGYNSKLASLKTIFLAIHEATYPDIPGYGIAVLSPIYGTRSSLLSEQEERRAAAKVVQAMVRKTEKAQIEKLSSKEHHQETSLLRRLLKSMKLSD